MLGAIIGDIVGSSYEFDDFNIKTTDFPLFSEESEITDDTIMTLAVAQGLINGGKDSQKTYDEITKCMQKLGNEYPYMSYGYNFQSWLCLDNPKPYNSYGNGSAMRVSSVACFFDNLDDVEKFAQNEGLSSQKQNLKTSEWVLKRIYQIQQNSKFRNSLKINTYE